MSRDPSDDSSPDSAPVISREAETPRGGFMARPGLKAPPRHAVVVRVGDAPRSEDIPVARSSAPPPPPTSEPAPDSQLDKITLRAVPKPSTPPPPPVIVIDEPSEALRERGAAREQPTIPSVLPAELARLRALESLPPPSDAPLVSSVRDSDTPRSRQAGSSRWPIVAAAAAGLVLGLASVATRVGTQRAAAPAPAVTLSQAGIAATPPRPTNPRAVAAPSTSARPAGGAPADADLPPRALPAARPASPGAKRSIF